MSDLDVENSELSPGVRRMLATVGQQAVKSFLVIDDDVRRFGLVTMIEDVAIADRTAHTMKKPSQTQPSTAALHFDLHDHLAASADEERAGDHPLSL